MTNQSEGQCLFLSPSFQHNTFFNYSSIFGKVRRHNKPLGMPNSNLLVAYGFQNVKHYVFINSFQSVLRITMNYCCNISSYLHI